MGIATVNKYFSSKQFQTCCILRSLGKRRSSSWYGSQRLTLQLPFIFWPTILLCDLSAKSFFSMRRMKLLVIPVICLISLGLLWVPGASSWLHNYQLFYLYLSQCSLTFLTICGACYMQLHRFILKSYPVDSVRPLDGNSINIFFESHFFPFLEFSIKILSKLIFPIAS